MAAPADSSLRGKAAAPSFARTLWSGAARTTGVWPTSDVLADPGLTGVGSRTARLFTLHQRLLLRGDHPRRGAPAQRPLYVAGVALPRTRADGMPASNVVQHLEGEATATIVEIDSTQPALRVVEHLTAPASAGESRADALPDVLQGPWRCRQVLVCGWGDAIGWRPGRLASDAAVDLVSATPPACSRLVAALLEAVGEGRVKMYAPSGSGHDTAFWGQVIRAQCRWGGREPQGSYMAPVWGDDGYVVSLALAIEAASRLLLRRAERLGAVAMA